MVELKIREILMAYLQDEYVRYSKIINNQSEHIQNINNDNIINNNERNQYMKILNDLIITLNNIYNEKLKILKSDDSAYEKKISNYEIFIGIDKIETIIDLIRTWEVLNINIHKELYFTDFKQINQVFIDIGKKIGFKNISDAMNISFGSKYKILVKSDKNFEIYENYFTPLACNTMVSNEKFGVYNYLLENNTETTIDNNIELKINIPSINKSIIINGYFKNDPINSLVRTSQFCKSFIYDKKNQFITLLSNNKYAHINDKFKDLYVKNLTIAELLCHTELIFSNKICSDYDKYIRYSKMMFKNLMQDFLSDSTTIRNQFDIIKLFLTGNTDENINMAGLLFGLLTDKKAGNDIIANIIYKNLNYNSQTKLRKSVVSIKSEFDKFKSLSIDNIDIRKHIVTSKNIPQHIKKIAFDKIDEMRSGGTEYYKQKTYLDIIINFPWHTDNDDSDIFKKAGRSLDESRLFLDNVKNTLDRTVFGHNECKSVMQELLGKWLTNSKSNGKAIGLVGPPGVGKTLIAKALGDALQIPFVQINLGGMEDRCILSGHSYTYSAAQPGLIVRKMVEAGKPRCVMYFDELDKACAKHGVNEIFNVLIHVTDPNTNANFSDAFFNEVTFNLDHVLFVFSYNDSDKIDKILLDRIEKIEVKPFSLNEKINIVRKFLLREIANDIGLKDNFIDISNEDIEYIIEQYTYEAGVREIKRKLESVFLKINLDRIYKRNMFENSLDGDKIIINRKYIDLYLNKPDINIKKIHQTDEIGIINGLYATTNGSGGIIPIIIYQNYIGIKDQFSLNITGSQGNVMKESVDWAFKTAMSLIKDEYRNNFLKNNQFGLHIHTPDGATPKDGPSAGAAFTTAFISCILGKKIKRDIAITGEIEMNGKITGIGGLAYKLRGACKAGVKIVFIPKENSDDLQKIFINDSQLKNNIQIFTVDHVSEILKEAFIENTDAKFDPNIYIT